MSSCSPLEATPVQKLHEKIASWWVPTLQNPSIR